MKYLTHRQYCDYYAGKCVKCNGLKQVIINNVASCCACQRSADLKYRFDQFEVSPSDLKYKTWDDFDGFGFGVDGKKQQMLTADSLLLAKGMALKYCFGQAGLSGTQDRKKHLIVHKHIRDGQNVIIVGSSQSGRTLLATLIIKEVVHACRVHSFDISFKCIKGYEIHNLARWDDAGKRINHSALSELSETDFLVIDQVDLKPIQGHHTNPADMYALDVLFGGRNKWNRPTIVACSPKFWSDPQSGVSGYGRQSISAQWSEEFVSMVTNPRNVVIDLKKEVPF